MGGNGNQSYEIDLSGWFKCDIERKPLKRLMRRDDFHALFWLAGYVALLLGTGFLAYRAIGTPWVVPAFFLYGTIYVFASPIQHETHHGTAFKNRWLNDIVHWIAGAMLLTEPVYTRWGHMNHHTYTVFTDKDIEIELPRPVSIVQFLLKLFAVTMFHPLLIVKHACGIITPKAKEIVPQSELPKMIWSARLFLLVYACVFALCFWTRSLLPLVFTVFARFYGSPIPKLLVFTQHVAMAENVYDHRLSTRTVKFNPLFEYLYWNMQHHLAHHLFPSVPFHALPKLHPYIKDQIPRVYNGLWDVYKEIIPALIRQHKDPAYAVRPVLPEEAVAEMQSSV
jgi:fatty acid desaturase